MFLRRRHSAFLQIAPITAPPPVPAVFFSANGPDWPATAPPAVFFLQMARIAPISRRAARYQKLSNPPLPLFARSANCTRFFAPCIFSAQISRLAKLCPFLHFSFVCKNQHFFACRNFKGIFWLFYFCTHFSKTEVFLRVPKIRLHFNHTKRGGIFHFNPPKQHLKLKFIFLKSTQNLWKGFWENLTMCHILPHFAGKQCAFFN